jgi:hypothetical protein
VLWLGVGLCVLALLLAAVGVAREPGPGMVLLAALASVIALGGLALAVWGLAYRRLAYVLAADGLEIHALGETFVAPYAAIDGIYTGQRLVSGENPLARRKWWPGLYIGHTRVRGIGRLHFFTTSQDAGALTVITFDGGGAVVSARTPQDFRTALIDRVSRSTEGDGGAVYARPARGVPWTAVRDLWLPASLLVGVVLLLIGLAVAALAFPSLPDQIALRLDAAGHPTQLAPRADLLHLPLVGALALVANGATGVWFHAREPLLARLLWVGAAALQAVLLVGIVRLLQ